MVRGKYGSTTSSTSAAPVTGPTCGFRQAVVVVGHVQGDGVALLPQVREADRLPRLLSRGCEDGKEDGGQDRDDSDDDEELDEGESLMGVRNAGGGVLSVGCPLGG